MRVIIFCALAALVGCSDGTVPETTATGGAGGQAVASTGGVGGHVMMMTATGGVVGTGGAAVTVDAGAPIDAQPDHPTPADQCVGIPRGQTSGPDVCGGPGTSQDISCVNLQSDVYNCGACFHSCPGAGATCQAGVCQCPYGRTNCGNTGTCVDLQSDSYNCGACAHACNTAIGSCQGGVCS